MAESLPPAKIVVRIDTDGALRELDKIGEATQKKIQEARLGVIGKTAAAIPTEKGHDDRPKRSRPDRIEKARGAVSRVKSVGSRVRRGLTQAAAVGVAAVGTAAFLRQAAEGVPLLEATMQKALEGSAWLTNKLAALESGIEAAQAAASSVKDLATLQLVAGATPTPDALLELGKTQFNLDMMDAELKRKIHQMSVAAVGEGMARMLQEATGQALNR